MTKNAVANQQATLAASTNGNKTTLHTVATEDSLLYRAQPM
jgi:hypothetical protein